MYQIDVCLPIYSLAAGDDLADLKEDAVHWAELAPARRAFLVPEVCKGVERLLILPCVSALHVTRAHLCTERPKLISAQQLH